MIKITFIFKHNVTIQPCSCPKQTIIALKLTNKFGSLRLLQNQQFRLRSNKKCSVKNFDSSEPNINSSIDHKVVFKQVAESEWRKLAQRKFGKSRA